MPSMRTGKSNPRKVRPKAKRKSPTMAQAQKAKQPTIKRAGRTAGAKMEKQLLWHKHKKAQQATHQTLQEEKERVLSWVKHLLKRDQVWLKHKVPHEKESHKLEVVINNRKEGLVCQFY